MSWRRHTKRRKPIRSLPDPQDPSYHILISTAHGAKLARQTIYNNWIKGKGRITLPKEAQPAVDQIRKDLTESFYERAKQPLTGERLQRLHRRLYETFSAIEKGMPGHTIIINSNGKSIRLSDSQYHLTSISDLAKKMDKYSKELKTISPGTTEHTAYQRTIDGMARVMVEWIVAEDLDHLRVPHSIKHIRESIQRNYPRLLSAEEINSMHFFDRMRILIERDVRANYRRERKDRLNTEFREAIRRKRWKDRLRKVTAEFVLPKTDRKRIREKFVENMTNRDEYTRKNKIASRPLLRAINDTFKRSRLALREELIRLGYDPEQIFERIGLNREMTASVSKPYSPEMMRKLQVFARAFYKHRSPEGKAALVQSILAKYEPAKSQLPRNETRVSTPTPRVNHRKALEREERKKRRLQVEQAGPNSPVAKPVELPDTLEGILSVIEKARRVDGSMYGRLRDILHKARPNSQNERAIIDGMKVVILCVRVSNYGVRGRVEPDVLRKKASPQHLHSQFDQALGELIHERKLKYELHGHKNDYVNLTDEFRAQALGHYDFRRAENHRH